MTFNEAINEVIYNNNIVWRQAYYHEHDYGDYDRPWSEWKRIRMEDDDPPYEAIIYFESNNRDERQSTRGTWFLTWKEDNLTKADLLADDWEVIEDEHKSVE